MLSIATLNVNSIRKRINWLVPYLQKKKIDIVLLQEIKCETNIFPKNIFSDIGYTTCIVYGQKSYNGVAILSRYPVHNIIYGIPGFYDENARFVMSSINCKESEIRIASIYAPNGNPIEKKLSYKLTWYQALNQFLKTTIEYPTIIAGDYNIIPEEKDSYCIDLFRNNALFHIQIRTQWRILQSLGYIDIFRLQHPHKIAYSYWDYTGNSFQKDNGLRIDHILTSPYLVDYMKQSIIDREPRSYASPSDHTPVIGIFSLEITG